MKKNLFLLCVLSFIQQIAIAQGVYYLPGSTQKIEQLVGDYDRERQEPNNNLTQTNYQLWGTDLGIPFGHNGKTYLLFGDTPGDLGFGVDRDPISFTTDTNPEDGIDLTFLTQSPNLYRPITIPGITQGALEVPLDGVSINNIMYIYHSTDFMTRSVLARSLDDGMTFQLVEDTISVNYFINISVNKVNRSDYPDLPGDFDNGLIILGTGKYRNSAIYMACQAADSIEFKESTYYFAGFSGQNPIWSKNELDAVPIISITCAGELSSAFNPHLNKWLVLYGCSDPRGIQFRTADVPWGPYSDAEIIFDPWADGGYCNFMHVNWSFMICDSVHDDGRESEWGGEYGSYMFKDMATVTDSFVTIYYTMSTWNPYTSVLMKSVLVSPITSTHSDISDKMPELYIYPNPTTGKFEISENFLKEKDIRVIVTDLTGRHLFTTSNSREIDLSSYAEGIYFSYVFKKQELVKAFKVVKMGKRK